MKEITSKKTKVTQFVTDEEWEWLKANSKARNFTMKEMIVLKKPIIDKSILMPKVQTKKNKDDRS